MRCEDCLAVVEEYFDGELNEETEGRVAAHVAACAECSEALDALADEHVLYARYDRGIEPSPALWQAVSARIAAADEAESFSALAPERLAASSILTRWRERVVSLFALPSFSPALAGGVALVAVCAFAGWLWLGTPRQQSTEMADGRTADAPQVVTPAPAVAGNKMPEIPDETIERRDTPVQIAKASNIESPSRPSAAAPRRVPDATSNAGVGNVNEPEGSVINHEHPTPYAAVALAEVTLAAETPAGPNAPRKPAGSLGEIEVARHLERAQLFLRTFSNVGDATDAAPEDIAYEKRVSRELLSENIVLRRESENSGAAPTKQLLNALEPFLLDIANLEDKPSNEDLRHIKERMEKKEIIAALRVY
ncbi:MAG TPA: zf-HC2 domain-containing protein [Pyrinomonadaceae bacterium]|nr:zf-HC2 domain-containing protein [Pyrinomonadaceae bacterium]